MRARNVYMAALRLRNLTTIELARRNGLSSPNIRQKINGRETIRAAELFQLLGMMDIDCRFQIRSDDEKEHESVYAAAKDVNIKDVFRWVINEKGISSYEASRRFGLNEQSMTQKVFQRETIQANEFFDVLDVLGVDCIFYDGVTKKELRDRREGHGVAAGVSDGKWYRTANADFVASSFMADGVNEYGPDGKAVDLYVDADGDNFMVEYMDGRDKGKIVSVPVHVADALLDKYGVDAEPV